MGKDFRGVDMVKLMPPLDGIIDELNKKIGEIKQSLVSIESRLSKFDAVIKAVNEKIKRIEKYAK